MSERAVKHVRKFLGQRVRYRDYPRQGFDVDRHWRRQGEL